MVTFYQIFGIIIHVHEKNARLAELADAQRSGRCSGD